MLIADFKPKPKERTFNLIGKVKVHVVIFLSSAAVLLIAIQLVFAASLATDGQKISQIEDEIKRFESENSSLRIQIAKHSSLTNLAQRAQDLGFKSPSRIIIP